MKRFHYYTPIFLQKVIYIFFYPFYVFFMHLEIKNKEHFRGLKGPIIIASNHTSELDPTVIPLVLDFFSELAPIYSVTNPISRFKEDDFGWRKHIYGKIFFSLLGGYPIYRGDKDYKKSLVNHIELLKENKTVCIFPEGKYTVDRAFGEAHGGLAFMAFETGAIIVPISINTLYNIKLRDIFLRRKKVILTVLPPVNIKDIISGQPSSEDFKKSSQIILDKIFESIKTYNS